LLRHAARARRVPAKGRMGTPHTPFFAREACRRRNPPQTSSPLSTVAAHPYGHSQGGRPSRSPADCCASVGRARGTGLLCAGVAPCHLAMQCARGSAAVVSLFVPGTSAAVPLRACLSRHSAKRDGGSALHPLRQAVKAACPAVVSQRRRIGHYVQGLTGLADLPCGRLGIRFSRPVARRALRQLAASSALACCRFC